jgi:acetyl-CoA carboxylase biotin carboxyl carrier protein
MSDGRVSERLELLLRVDGERALLLAPLVGHYTRGPAQGRVLQAGEACGALIVLGRPRELVVPAGVHGRVVGAPPERVLHPVAHGDVLFELAPLADLAAVDAPQADARAANDGKLVFRAPSAGRYWQRPAPSEPAFVEAGASIANGSALGLIEVMKTFTRIVYRPAGGLPERARVTRVLVADGAEVADGDALLELEPG